MNQALHQLKKRAMTRTTVHPKYFGAAYTKLYLENVRVSFNVGETKFTAIRHSNIMVHMINLTLKSFLGDHY